MDKLGKIRRLHWKERLEVRKIVKFEGDLSKTIVDAKFYSLRKEPTFRDVTTGFPAK